MSHTRPSRMRTSSMPMLRCLAFTVAAPMRKATRLGVALGVVTMAATACGNAAAGSGGPDVDVVGTWTAILPSTGLQHPPGPVTIDFKKDGDWQGTDGCNRYVGTYSVDGHHLDATADRDSVGGECAGPTVIWMDVMPKVEQVEQHGRNVRLLDDSGKTIAEIRKRATS